MNQYFQIEEYHRPQNLIQAIDILSKFGNSAGIIAGGTDILPRRPGVGKSKRIMHLVDISELGLQYLKKDKNHIRIGAATPINTIAASPLLSSGPYMALHEAANAHSTTTIRNRASIGGNLCTGSSAADLALPLLALDAILVVAGPKKERQIQMKRWFKGANYTALKDAEILREIRVPLLSGKEGTAFKKLTRHQTSIDKAVVSTAAFLSCTNGQCDRARIVLGAVGPIPFRAQKAESMLTGVTLNPQEIQMAAGRAAEDARPIGDVRATAAYRKKMIAVLVRRAVENCFQRCEK